MCYNFDTADTSSILRYSQDYWLQGEACLVLANLTERPETHPDVVAADAPRVVLCAMALRPLVDTVQRHGC